MARTFRSGRVFVALILGAVVGLRASEARAQTKTLDVTVVPQETNMWCWAASAQMVMAFHGENVTQCTQANRRFGFSDCCNNQVPNHCVQGGWPEFYKYGFTYSETTNSALSWQQVNTEIDANRPVAFSWHWDGGGGHMMVLRGYSTLNGVRYVAIHDPWPPKIGDSKSIPYSAYVSGSGYTHWNDYFNIREGVGRIAMVNAGQPSPEPQEESGETPIGVDVASLLAAEKETRTIAMNAQKMLEGVAKDVPGWAPTAKLGDPVAVHVVGLNELQKVAPGAGPRLLLKPGVNRMVYPLVHDNEVVSAITLQRGDDKKWEPPSFGGTTMARLLAKARGDLAKRVGDAESPAFCVAVPALNFYAVAVQRKDKVIEVLPVIAYPELGLKEGQPVPASTLTPLLIEAAKRHDGLPR